MTREVLIIFGILLVAIPDEIRTELIRDTILVLQAVTTFVLGYLAYAGAKLLRKQKSIETSVNDTAEKVKHLVSRGVSRETDKPASSDSDVP